MPMTGHYNAQSSLLKKMSRLGYKTDANGICAGATMVAIEAGVNHGNTDLFDDTIKFICSKEFKLQRITPGKKLFLSKEERDILDAHATLDQIQIYHKPQNHYDVFNKTLTQYQAGHIAEIAQSNKSIFNQGLVTHDNWSWSGIYKEKNLIDLLRSIKRSADENQLLAFNVDNISHKVALIYNQGKWTLTNINRMPSRHFTSTTKLAKKIKSILGNKHTKTSTLAFSAYSAGNKTDQTQIFFNKLRSDHTFKKQHRLTKNTLRKKQRDIMRLAQLSVCNHQTDTLDQLIKNGLDVNAKTVEGHTLALLASRFGHIDMLNTLISAGADINTTTGDHGLTPLVIATQFQHPETVSFLLDHNADISQENGDHVPPIAMAADTGNLESVRILAQHGAKLNEHTLFGTPLEIARKNGHKEVAEFIEHELETKTKSK